MNINSKAYRDGLEDGADWGLDGYDSPEAARAERDWATATINALGTTECAKRWGVSESDEGAWSEAIQEYNAGVIAAVAER